MVACVVFRMVTGKARSAVTASCQQLEGAGGCSIEVEQARCNRVLSCSGTSFLVLFLSIHFSLVFLVVLVSGH